MNEWNTLADAMRLAGWIVWPLSVLAVLALAITFDRLYVLARFGTIAAAVSENPDTEAASAWLRARPPRHALARVARLFAASFDAPSDTRAARTRPATRWRIEAKVAAVVAQIERDMSRGLWLLETIVTAAPLLGLLGTIVGMMHSFRLIGGDGLVNPAGVSGGVAQALIATAIGLVIALVSLFAFNYLSRRIDQLMDELEAIANTWLAALPPDAASDTTGDATSGSREAFALDPLR